MTAPRDKFGRPIVVVTGMGIVTSLGAGKTDNWRKLTAGESGIRTVTRFPIDGLKSTMAGTVDFVTVEPSSSTGLTERLADLATEEALEQSGIGRKGDFPGPLFLAVAPIEVEWPQRIEVGRASASRNQRHESWVSGGGKLAYHHRFMFARSQVSRRKFGTIAALASTASRPRHRDPVGTGSKLKQPVIGRTDHNGFIPALPALRRRTPRRRPPSVLEEPRRFRHGGRRRRAGARKL